MICHTYRISGPLTRRIVAISSSSSCSYANHLCAMKNTRNEQEKRDNSLWIFDAFSIAALFRSGKAQWPNHYWWSARYVSPTMMLLLLLLLHLIDVHFVKAFDDRPRTGQKISERTHHAKQTRLMPSRVKNPHDSHHVGVLSTWYRSQSSAFQWATCCCCCRRASHPSHCNSTMIT